MPKHVKRGHSPDGSRRPVIIQGRFWWQYDDGHRERIYMSDKARGHLWQAKGADTQRNPKEQTK